MRIKRFASLACGLNNSECGGLRVANNRGTVWRLVDVALAVWLAGYAFVVVVSEALSVFGVFRPGWIRAVWLAVAMGGSVGAWGMRERLRASLVGAWGALRGPRSVVEWCVAATGALTLLCAVMAPTSAQDALVYHLPRASHWLTNGSTGFYETAIARQNFQAQGFSLCVAHVLAVCGSDRWVNLLQWCAWWLFSGTAGLAAAEVGAGAWGRRCAALLALTLPQAIAQSTQAVGDLFATVPFLAFALYLLRMERSEGRALWGWALAAGGALGLACMARQTGLVYGAVFGCSLGICTLVRCWKESGLRRVPSAALSLGVVALVGVSCAVPQMTRNWREYGDLFSGEPKHALTTEHLTPRLFAVNVAKHVATHLSMPMKLMNAPIERVVRWMGGAAVEDPRIHCNDTVFPIPFKMVSVFGKDVSFVTNPLHFILFCVALSGWLVGGARAKVLLTKIGVPVFAGAVLYCALFKWQLWAVRLTIPLYGWMSVGVGTWLGTRLSSMRMRGAVLGVFAACAVMQVVARPVWFMPAFLFGEGTKGSGITREMTVAEKIRRLTLLGWPASELAAMRMTVPEVERWGYSLFYTPRQRQYLGNETYQPASWVHEQLADALKRVARQREEIGVSKTVGLIMASDHSNMPPEVRQNAYPCEYPMWTWGGGEAGGRDWRLEHFGASDPAARAKEIFGQGRGVILSDRMRESVVSRLRAVREVTLVASNGLYNVYAVGAVQ